jgi:formate--tetrahydrofolate ligase
MLIKGLPNLEKHLENIGQFNVTPVIAINRFSSDTEEEIEVIRDKARSLGVRCSVADLWARGGEGALELAKLVTEVAESNPPLFTPMYDWKWDVKKKVETIATKIYGICGLFSPGQE